MSSSPALETFPNPRPGREYEIAIACPEFTSMCPKTGLPDFGTIRIRYVPGESCIELKSLKFYLIGFRNQGLFYEAATNRILDDLVAACQPRRMIVVGDFTARGGITTAVTAEYIAELRCRQAAGTARETMARAKVSSSARRAPGRRLDSGTPAFSAEATVR